MAKISADKDYFVKKKSQLWTQQLLLIHRLSLLFTLVLPLQKFNLVNADCYGS